MVKAQVGDIQIYDEEEGGAGDVPYDIVSTVPEAEPYTEVTVTFEIVDDATFTVLVPADSDSDGFYDQFDLNYDGDFDDTNELDNCPEAYNPGQEDGDGDGVGDACDSPVAVGRIAEYTDVAGAAAGYDYVPVAVMGGLAIFAVTAGVWYARSRRCR